MPIYRKYSNCLNVSNPNNRLSIMYSIAMIKKTQNTHMYVYKPISDASFHVHAHMMEISIYKHNHANWVLFLKSCMWKEF